MSDETRIPDALLALLKEPWAKPQTPSVFERNYSGKRVFEPNFYSHWRDEAGRGTSEFDTKEIAALAAEGLLNGLHREHEETIAVNEHAEHAIRDFCGQVYAAWAELDERLRAVAERRPLGFRDEGE